SSVAPAITGTLPRSLLDALPILAVGERVIVDKPVQEAQELRLAQGVRELADPVAEVEVERLFQLPVKPGTAGKPAQLEEAFDFRSEEHTSELQSRENLVCRLLPE